jgi:anti-anti-sigma regulatory factor
MENEYFAMEEVDGVYVITFPEWRDCPEDDFVRAMGQQLCALVERNCMCFVIDFDRMQTFTAGAFGKLLAFQRYVWNAHGKLVLCSLSGKVVEVLFSSHLETAFAVRNNRKSALESL